MAAKSNCLLEASVNGMDAIPGPTAAATDARAKFVAGLSARFDGFAEAWEKRAKEIAAERAPKQPSTVAAALNPQDSDRLHRQLNEHCDRIEEALRAAWRTAFQQFMGDVSVDLLQYRKEPLQPGEELDLATRLQPLFPIDVAKPQSGALKAMAAGAFMGACYGSVLGGVGAVPGALLGGFGGLAFSSTIETASIFKQAHAAIEKSLEEESQKLRCSKLKLVERVLELRWGGPAAEPYAAQVGP